MTELADDLSFALDLADLADGLAMASFRAADLVVETKPDLTPVSEADRAVERAIREQLAAHRPDDAVLGEEYGQEGTATRRWIIDPIDGTKNYVRGVPVWATLIALLDGDDVVVGVVSAPALARRWWAATGMGAFVADPGESGASSPPRERGTRPGGRVVLLLRRARMGGARVGRGPAHPARPAPGASAPTGTSGRT